MALAIRSPLQTLQTGTSTRLAVSPDQRLGVQEFLHSLKKKPTRPLPTPKHMEAPQDKTSTSCQLTVQGFPQGLRKPMTPHCKPAEAAVANEAPKLQTVAPTGLEDLPVIDSAAPGLSDSPKSTTSEIDCEQVLGPSLEARRLRSSNAKGADEKDESMKIPKVTRTYTKKAKHVSPQQNDSPALFLTQSSPHERALLDGPPDDGSDPTTEQLAFTEPPKNKPAKKYTSAVPRKRKQQPLQDDEIRREGHREYNADNGIIEKDKKAKRKKRRVPVNELALVKRLPSREHSPENNQNAYDSDNAIDLLDEYLDGQGFPASTSPILARSRKPTRANTGKPVTRIRQEIVIPQRELLAREGFKFPPITPRATKSPGWKLGSGFEGITLESSTNKRPETSRNQKFRHAKTPCPVGRPLPRLELSTNLPPTRQSVGQKAVSKKQKDQGGFVETSKYELTSELGTADGVVQDEMPHRAAKIGRKPTFEHVASLTALLLPPIENHQSQIVSSSYRNSNVKEPLQRYQSQNRDLDASQAIRRPSKSERTGWLKRRKVDSAVGDEDEEEQLFVHTQRTSINAGEHERRKGRSGFDTYLGETAQAQHAVYKDLQASNEGGQTTPNPKRPVNSHVFQDEQSAEQHPRRVSHEAQLQSSDSEEEIFNHQSSGCPPEPPPSSHSETDLPSSPSDARTSKPSHQIQVPRTSEVPETQDRLRGSIELDHAQTENLDPDLHSYRIPATTLESGKYFSKAVQLLDSPEKVPHTVMRRKSRRGPDQDVRGSQVVFGTQQGGHHVSEALMERSQKQEGSLELGVTPRLKSRMSNVPFRPPFKEPL